MALFQGANHVAEISAWSLATSTPLLPPGLDGWQHFNFLPAKTRPQRIDQPTPSAPLPIDGPRDATMRVINTTTLQLQDINPENRGARYAILSHIWGSEEVLFDDIRNLGPRELATKVRKRGASKIIGSCIQAKKDRCDYIWIDTCCIDKSSSAELSEVINSMFKWYALAEQCYAYLGDVSMATPEKDMWSLRGSALRRTTCGP